MSGRSAAEERLLAALVSGNLLLARDVADLAAATGEDVETVAERASALVETGLLVEVSDGRYSITDEGFEVVVEALDLP